MGLRERALADTRAILNDRQCGSGYPVTVTPPTGAAVPLVGWTNDIGLLVDPDTGQAVSGRSIVVTLSLVDLQAANLSIPENVPDLDRNPWVLSFTDLVGGDLTTCVTESAPDRILGFVNLTVEHYRTAT